MKPKNLTQFVGEYVNILLNQENYLAQVSGVLLKEGDYLVIRHQSAYFSARKAFCKKYILNEAYMEETGAKVFDLEEQDG